MFAITWFETENSLGCLYSWFRGQATEISQPTQPPFPLGNARTARLLGFSPWGEGKGSPLPKNPGEPRSVPTTVFA